MKGFKMTFKDENAKADFQKLYKENASNQIVLFSFIFSVAEEIEESAEKTFDKFAEIFMRISSKEYISSLVLSELSNILDVFRKYWKFGNIIPAR